MIKMNKTIKLTAGMIITLALAISGTYYLTQGDSAYYCQDKDIVMVCDKLSNTNDLGLQTRCYYEDTYKTCSSGWDKIELNQEITNNYQGKQYLCNQINCTEIKWLKNIDMMIKEKK